MEILIADTNRLGLGERWRAYQSCLSPEDRQRVDRYLREEDRVRCVTGALLGRAAAARRLGNWDAKIRRNAFGKPFFSDGDGLFFNLSHAHELVVFAEADAPVGIDVERVDPLDWDRIASTFRAEEQALITAAGEPLECFYRIWTAREAFAKEEGIGLSIFEEEVVMDHAAQTVRRGGRTIPFRVFPYGDYRIAVCCAALTPCTVVALGPREWAERVERWLPAH